MRTLILVVLTFTMAVTSIIIPDTYIDFDYENASYLVGADIVVSGVSLTDIDFKNTIQSIEGVAATTYIARLSYDPVTRGSVTYYYQLIGINISEYSTVCYNDKEYTNGDLFATTEKLNQPLTPGISANVLVNIEQTKAFELELNDTLNIYYPYWSGGFLLEENYTLRMVGYYNFWPTLYLNKPEQGSTNFRLGLVTTINHIKSLTRDPTDVYYQLLIDVEDGYKIGDIADQIQEKAFGRRVDDVDSKVTIARGSLRLAVIFGSLNSNFLASAFILILAIALMTVIHSIDRSNEVGIMKAIGISPRQLFYFFFTESFTVIIIGSLAGILLGLMASFMFMSIITVNSILPPWEMVYSPLKLILTIVVMLTISLASAAIPGLIFARRKEASIIREI